MVHRRVPEQGDSAPVLGDRLERRDRCLEGGLGIEVEVAPLGQGRVHHRERQLPPAGLTPLGVPEPVRIRRPGPQAGE